MSRFAWWRLWLGRRSRHGKGRSARARPRLESLEDRTLLTGGALDPTFGTGGVVNFNFGLTDHLKASALQADGKIIAVGTTAAPGSNGGHAEIALARFNADGSLDTTFGTGGRVVTSFGADSDTLANAVALDSQGRIVVAGSHGAAQHTQIVLARYNADGSLDTTFGTGGEVTTPVGANAYATSVAVQPDGEIVVAGAAAAPGSGTDFAVLRYTTGGRLDGGFGTDGVVKTDLGAGDAAAEALALQADGKIIAAGHTSTSGGNFHFALVRYNLNGTLDTTFNHTGEVLDNYPGASATLSDEAVHALALQPDGKIVAAGSFNAADGLSDAALLRYNPDGSLDTTFGGTGRVALRVGGSQGDSANAVAVAGDGHVVIAGSDLLAGGGQFLVASYNADGTPDAGFGSGGVTLTPVGTGASDGFHGVQVLDGSRVLAEGDVDTGTDSNFGLARYANSFTVIGVPPMTTVTQASPSSSAAFGQPVSLTVTVVPGAGGPVPTGSVTFHDGPLVLAAVPLQNVGGVATAVYTTPFTLALGAHGITATYNPGGDPTYSSSASAVFSYLVNPEPTTTVITQATPAQPNAGDPVTLTATVTPADPGLEPSGTVTFMEGGVTLGSVGLVDVGGVATATFTTAAGQLGAGPHEITAVYSPGTDPVFQGSTSAEFTVTVGKLTTSLTLNTSDADSPYGQAVITAVVTGDPAAGSPTGEVSFDITGPGGTMTVTAPLVGNTATLGFALEPGTYSISASYAGDANFEGSSSSAPLSQVVTKDPTGVLLSVNPTPATEGEPITLNAAILNVPAGAIPPQGSVTFFDGGAELGFAGLDSSGHAVFGVSSLPAGSHTITAVYSGDAHFAGSSMSVIENVDSLTPPPATDITAVAPALVVASPLNGPMQQTVAVQNFSGTTISGPVYVLVHGLPRGVRLRGASGIALAHGTPGDAYVRLPIGGLSPGARFRFVLRFINPQHKRFRLQTQVLTGWGIV